MENKENNSKNSIFFLKIKKYEKKMPFRRRDINSSILNDYDKIFKEMLDEIMKIEVDKNLKGRFPILVISHPDIKDIFIYSKEQWDLYFNYNIIEKCKSNKSFKIEYYLLNNTNKTKDSKIEQKIKDCKKEIIKYIIETIACDKIFNILIKFLNQRKDFAELFKEYLITDLINNNRYKIDEKDSNEDLDENININEIMNYDEKDDIKINKIDKKKIEKRYKGYYIDNNEFTNVLNNKFKVFSKHQKSFNYIRNILKDDEEKNKKDIRQIKKDNEQNEKIYQSLELRGGQSLENLINDSSSFSINDNVLQSVLNPPSKYIPNLMVNDKFFKKFNKDEYYIGIEDYKDQLNRESFLMLNKNT